MAVPVFFPSSPLPYTGIASIIANVNNQAFAVIVAWKRWKPPEIIAIE